MQTLFFKAIIFFLISIITLKKIEESKGLDFQLYNESRWDPLTNDPELEPVDRQQYIKTISGFFRDHDHKGDSSFKRFGDISIITLNLFRDIVADYETLQSAENIRTLLDEAHPTFLCLQGIDDSLLTRINGKLSDHNHYQMATFDKYDVEMLSGQRNYLPIIYDSNLVSVHRSGYFETEQPHQMRYGSFIEVKDRRKKSERISFTVINVDMYSSFNEVVSAQFSNIISDINGFKEVEALPVFVVGGMGTMPPNVHEMMKTYKNSIEVDANNRDIPKTTVHAGSQDDNVQRDFILLRDANSIFDLNYARILREFLASDHYPVHAIYSYKTSSPTPKKKDKAKK